jgi:flavin reductase (DIM6/NTAB) family NADH-FMN oxidoreductase RutF
MLFPYPVTLVGADVDEKPNFMTIAFIGIVNINPSMIALGANRGHYTTKGIQKNKSFSVNIPSEELLYVTDYMGLKSGRDIDKSKEFEIFYGKLKNAPMIKECPINLECKLLQYLNMGGADDIVIGEIVESYVDEKCLTGDKVDIEKLRPMIFSMYENKYLGVGKVLGEGWNKYPRLQKIYKPFSLFFAK